MIFQRPEDDPEEAPLKEKQVTRFIELIQATRCCFPCSDMNS